MYDCSVVQNRECVKMTRSACNEAIWIIIKLKYSEYANIVILFLLICLNYLCVFLCFLRFFYFCQFIHMRSQGGGQEEGNCPLSKSSCSRFLRNILEFQKHQKSRTCAKISRIYAEFEASLALRLQSYSPTAIKNWQIKLVCDQRN